MTQARRDAAVALGLFAAIFLLYARTITFDFVNVDDPLQITSNDVVGMGVSWTGIRYAFTTVVDGNYMPMTWLSHLVTVEIWGLSPAAHHAVNAGLHAANVVMLFIFLRLTTGARGRSAVVAALFGLHPLRVESVAWVAERKDMLSGAFWMLSLLAYWHYATRPSAGRYLGLAFVFAVGLLSKSMLVTLPCVFLLLDVWPLRRVEVGLRDVGKLARLVAEKIPLIMLSAAAAIVALYSQHEVGAARMDAAWGISDRLITAMNAYGAYLLATVWPIDLAVYYPLPEEGMSVRVAMACATLIGVVTAGSLATWKSRPYLATGWLWFVGTLVPVIGLVQLGGQSHADRYTYLPQIGIFLACVWAVHEMMSLRPSLARLQRPVGVTVCAICAVLSWRQLDYWRNSEVLFARTLAVTDDNWFAEGNYASALIDRGAYKEAERHLRAAIGIGPARYNDFMNLGRVLILDRRLSEAAQVFAAATELFGDRAAPWAALANARLRMSDAKGAADAYERVLRIEPGLINARINLAVCYGMLGREEEAREQFENVLAKEPDNADVLYNYGTLEFGARNFDRAHSLLQRSVEIDSQRADAWYYLAACDAHEGRIQDALQKLRNSISLDKSLSEKWMSEPFFDNLRQFSNTLDGGF
jgi:tetratricopeptide (TPR) repeat protein